MSAPRKQYRKGDPARNFAADDFNAIAAEVERWANLKAIAPLAIGDGPGGRYLTRDGEPSFYAKLSGASSPYSWTEQVETSSGVWANGERTGTDAYEVNSRTSLNNKIARLYPTPFDHRFRFITGGGTGGGTGNISVRIQNDCNSAFTPSDFNVVGIDTTVTAVDSLGVTRTAVITRGLGTAGFTGIAAGTASISYAAGVGSIYTPTTDSTTGAVPSGGTLSQTFNRTRTIPTTTLSWQYNRDPSDTSSADILVTLTGPAGYSWSGTLSVPAYPATPGPVVNATAFDTHNVGTYTATFTRPGAGLIDPSTGSPWPDPAPYVQTSTITCSSPGLAPSTGTGPIHHTAGSNQISA